MKTLDNRVAIITGAAGGIGRGVVQRFADEGALLVLADIKTGDVQDLARTLVDAGSRAIGVGCDVANEDDITRVIDAAIAEFGQIDILVNLAQGGLADHTYLDGTTAADAASSMLTGPIQSMLFMQKCLPYMRERGYGRIINTGSHAALTGLPGFAPYAMAKGAVQALTRSASQEWGQYGIVTNTFVPILRTPAYDTTEQGRATIDQITRDVPVGKFGTAYDDGSPVLVFLASEGAGYINGQTISADGGWRLIS